MLDAADCFQASTFNALHGFYRSGISNLRSALELVAIGTLGNLSPEDKTYFRWKTSSIGSLPFRAVTRKLRRAAKSFDASSLRKPLEALYHELSAYSHSRPDSTDAELWRSNGPIYVGEGFQLVYELQTSIYAGCYALAKIGRSGFDLPKGVAFLFETPGAHHRSEIADSYRSL